MVSDDKSRDKMNPQDNKTYLRPEDVKLAEADKVLARLNTAATAEEIANDIIAFTGDRIISIRVAQGILDTRERLGGLKDLKQVASVPGVGAKRFTIMVQAFANEGAYV